MIEKRFPEKEEQFFRAMMFPEEDRHRHTTKAWDGSFRFFRAGNVLCFEHYRRVPEPPAALKSKPAA